MEPEKQERNPEQGTGGIRHSSDIEHTAWISWYMSQHQHLRGMCLGACRDMLQSFPDLRLVRGWVASPDFPAAKVGKDLLDAFDPDGGHFWLETRDGLIVDPTKDQFEDRVFKYLPLDESISHLLPTGKCPNDGWHTYHGNYFCSYRCEVEYQAYLRREMEGRVRFSNDAQEYVSICPNGECGCVSTKPVPVLCPYCQIPMIEIPTPPPGPEGDGGDLLNGDAQRDEGSHGPGPHGRKTNS